MRLLPGRAATSQLLQRCIGVFAYVFSFPVAIFLLFSPMRTSLACWVKDSPHRAVLKTFRSLTWSILCTWLLVIFHSVLFLFFWTERVWKWGWDRCCFKWCNQQISASSRSSNAKLAALIDFLTSQVKSFKITACSWRALSVRHWVLMQVEGEMHRVKGCSGAMAAVWRRSENIAHHVPSFLTPWQHQHQWRQRNADQCW